MPKIGDKLISFNRGLASVEAAVEGFDKRMHQLEDGTDFDGNGHWWNVWLPSGLCPIGCVMDVRANELRQQLVSIEDQQQSAFELMNARDHEAKGKQQQYEAL